ncbi:MAG: hypothetical protein QXQ14_01295 [Candidatus Aenigmatarchaeota archaeon]
MSLPYARKGAWKGLNKTQILLRKFVYDIFYRNLEKELYETKTVVVIGPSKEEEKHIKNILEKHFNIIIFEPDSSRYKELIKEFENYVNIKVINDYGYNISKYLEENYIDALCAFNVINWKPFVLKSFLQSSIKALKQNGYVVISFYIKIFEGAKDKEFLTPTPRKLINSIYKFRDKIVFVPYIDGNGILLACKIPKEILEKIYEKL